MEYKPVTLNGTWRRPRSGSRCRCPDRNARDGDARLREHPEDDRHLQRGLGAKSNETSGKAIIARQREGDVGTFHFTDNLNISRNHAGRCILSMLPYYYDTERDVRAIGEDGTPSKSR
jgi:hypothetical protein